MLLSRLLRAYVLGRLIRGARRGGRRGPAYAYRPRRRGRARFVGPFPTYSTRTRRGSRVTVSGCCLPIPLTLAVAAAAGVRALMRR
jgi:hypothetical protein